MQIYLIEKRKRCEEMIKTLIENKENFKVEMRCDYDENEQKIDIYKIIVY